MLRPRPPAPLVDLYADGRLLFTSNAPRPYPGGEICIIFASKYLCIFVNGGQRQAVRVTPSTRIGRVGQD